MRFQHDVWKAHTNSVLDGLHIGEGWRCLDVGAGPGFTTADLRERVGARGSVTALEPSRLYTDHLRALVSSGSWTNVDIIPSTVGEATLPVGAFDLVFVRWVLNFVEDRPGFLETLARSTAENGVITVLDYWYEGLSVFPRGTPFERIPDIARAYYRSGGGDAYGIGSMPGVLAGLGFELLGLTPLQLAGGNTSVAFRWAFQFFTEHLPIMEQKGIITAAERDEQLQNFSNLAGNPEMMFFSPIVLACSMRKLPAARAGA